MAELTYLDLIKISEFPIQNDVVEGDSWFIITGADGIGHRISEERLRYFLTTSTGGFMGDATTATEPNEALGPQFYIASQDGTYTSFDGLVATLSEGITIFSYDGDVWGKTVVPVNLSGVVQNSDLEFSEAVGGKNKLDESKFVDDKFVNLDGSITDSNGSVSVIDQKIISGETYTISGIVADSLKKYVVRDSGGTVLSSGSMSPIPKTVTIPSNGETIDFTAVRSATGGTADVLQIEIGSSATIYEPPVRVLTGLQGYLAEAKILSEGNVVPDPVTQLNAVNLRYFNLNTVKPDDVTIEPVVSDVNLLDPAYYVEGMALDSSGEPITATSGRSMIDLPIEGSTTYTLSGIFGDSLKKMAFFDVSGVRTGSVLGLGTIPFTATSPPDAVTVNITLRRNTDDPADILATAQLEEGSNASAFEPFESDMVTGILGYDIASAKNGSGTAPSSFDQSLNTTDNVEFNTLTVQGMVLNLPEGAGSPPVGVEIGDAWVDTTNNTIKVRRT